MSFSALKLYIFYREVGKIYEITNMEYFKFLRMKFPQQNELIIGYTV